MKPTIQEIIIVEGKDDVSAVQRAVNATVLITNGMGLEEARLAEMTAMAKKQGAIILTDPDVPGTLIREAVAARIPGVKHAFLTRKAARHPQTGRLGVEYASPEAIRQALEKCYATTQAPSARYTMSDLMQWGLVGRADSKARRSRFCDMLHLGQANGKALLARLNRFGIAPDAISDALSQLEANDDPK
ncbi:MAG: ribonuclease M5 [Peptococcaceae bacterium]|nr:ribonuclease M5 [Peptococcaceae bacterium]